MTCTVCAAKYQTAKINCTFELRCWPQKEKKKKIESRGTNTARASDLTEPIDVFCEWLDACEDENAEGDDDDEDDS